MSSNWVIYLVAFGTIAGSFSFLPPYIMKGPGYHSPLVLGSFSFVAAIGIMLLQLALSVDLNDRGLTQLGGAIGKLREESSIHHKEVLTDTAYVSKELADLSVILKLKDITK